MTTRRSVVEHKGMAGWEPDFYCVRPLRSNVSGEKQSTVRGGDGPSAGVARAGGIVRSGAAVREAFIEGCPGGQAARGRGTRNFQGPRCVVRHWRWRSWGILRGLKRWRRISKGRGRYYVEFHLPANPRH